jgi:hypothetical protein
MQDGMTSAELIAAARRAGWKVSKPMLKRLRDNGLIPRPEPRPTKGVLGIPQVHPEGTLRQLLAVCELRRNAWRFDELRILSWWNRLWIDRDQLRISLKTVLQEDRDARTLRQAYNDAEQDPVEAAHLVLERDTSADFRHPTIRLFLRRLGGDRNDLYTVAYTLLVLAFGGEPEWDSTDVGLDDPLSGKHIVEASPRELLERALGIDRLLRDDLGNGPWLKERPDIAADMERLRDVGAFEVLRPADLFDAASDAELDDARDRAAVLFDLLPVAAKAIETMFGRDFAGMGLFRAASQRATAFLRVSIVRYGLLMPALVEDQAVQEVAAALIANAPIFHAVLQLTNAFPGYKKYLTPAGVAQLDTLAAEELLEFRSKLSHYVALNPQVAAAFDQRPDSGEPARRE